LNISLDYDNTYTADKNCMKALIRCLQSCGHKVYCVTLRSKDLDWHDDFEELANKYEVETIFCDGESKRKVTELQGIKIDVWIDDWPEGIPNGSQYTPIQLTEWRKEQRAIGGITR